MFTAHAVSDCGWSVVVWEHSLECVRGSQISTCTLVVHRLWRFKDLWGCPLLYWKLATTHCSRGGVFPVGPACNACVCTLCDSIQKCHVKCHVSYAWPVIQMRRKSSPDCHCAPAEGTELEHVSQRSHINRVILEEPYNFRLVAWWFCICIL